MKEGRERVYLIDGYSTIFRAFYAIPSLTNSRGEPTNAVYGFLNMLRKLLREEKPDLVGIALDVSRKTIRSDRYAEYKANRAPMPDDLRAQIPHVRRAIEALRIPALELEGYEADDVLGSLARQAVDAGYEVILVTADKDLFQLVGPSVYLYHTGREKLYDPALVEEDFGVPPSQVVDVLALMGDSVDNVPGVPGIGEKGAKKLILEYGDLEQLLEHAAEIKRKNYREGLEQHREEALLSRELVTIHSDLDVPFDAGALRLEAPDTEALYELYRELDFFSLLEELEKEGGGPKRRQLPSAIDCESPLQWRQETEGLTGRVVVAGVGPGRPVGLSFVIADERTLWVDWRQAYLAEAASASLRDWLSRNDVELVGHDLKEVLHLLDRDIVVAARLTDTMLLAYLLRGSTRSFGFEEVVLDRLHHKVMSVDEMGFKKGEPPMPGDPRLLAAAGERALLSLELAGRLATEIEEAVDLPGDVESVYRQIEEPLLPVLLRMEAAGIELDTELLGSMSEELKTEIARLEREIYDIAGEEFNVNSSQQLGVILFEKLGYPILKRTRKTKKYSTSAETLEELAARGFDLPERLIAYRELTKLKSTYVDALPQLVDARGRLHTHYHQAVAATGRLSSQDPNLQNIPVRTTAGQEIRRAFRAAEGCLLVVADYSQIELRILAHIAQEEALIQAFRAGADIHQSTAASVFDVAPELVTAEQRRAAKVINFGLLYGMSAYGLAQNLGISPKEAKTFIDAYFERFPKVLDYTRETVEEAERDLCVVTLYGRTRWLPEIKSRNYPVRENAKRMAINARIQGTAADLQKLAMIAVDELLRDSYPKAELLLTVHDELVLEVPTEDCDALEPNLRSRMEGIAQLDVPLVVDIGRGATWYDAK